MGTSEAENAREIAGLTLSQRKSAALEGLKYCILYGFGENSDEEKARVKELTEELTATGATMVEIMEAIREAKRMAQAIQENCDNPEAVAKADHLTVERMTPTILPFLEIGGIGERSAEIGDTTAAEVSAIRLRKRQGAPITEPDDEVSGAFVFLGAKFRQFMGMSDQPCSRPEPSAETAAK